MNNTMCERAVTGRVNYKSAHEEGRGQFEIRRREENERAV